MSGTRAGADAAAKAFHVKAAYATADDLFRDPSIDIVSVAVKVPDHRDLVLGALAAGKHLYCEWPLGRNLEESEELASAAKTAGVHCAIGLQTRMNPAVRQAQSLLATGAIGRLLSARVTSTAVAYGPKVEKAMAFGEDGANGVTLVTIQGGHTLDLVIKLLGELEDVSALATTQFPEVYIGDSTQPQRRSTPDHLLVHSRLASGLPVGIEVAGGRPAGNTPFLFQVVGEKGELLLAGGAPRGFQSGKLRLSMNGQEQEVDEGELAGLPENAFNVAGVYATLRDDINSGTHTVADFDHAVQLTRLIDAALSSSEEGRRKLYNHWPSRDASPKAKEVSGRDA